MLWQIAYNRQQQVLQMRYGMMQSLLPLLLLPPLHAGMERVPLLLTLKLCGEYVVCG
jgi:hypothetical protein